MDIGAHRRRYLRDGGRAKLFGAGDTPRVRVVRVQLGVNIGSKYNAVHLSAAPLNRAAEGAFAFSWVMSVSLRFVGESSECREVGVYLMLNCLA
jgi:hypothetical protein